MSAVLCAFSATLVLSVVYLFATVIEACLQNFHGKYLTTLKLHIAAMHLADQVTSCGPGFIWTEFWIERMVQLVKRMVKYRSTAYPELLFIHDWLLTMACRRVKLMPDGKHCLTLDEALFIAKKKHLRQHDNVVADEALLLGAPKPLSPEEEKQVLCTPADAPAAAMAPEDSLDGLPFLLHTDQELERDGWPVFRGASNEDRCRDILHELGLQGPAGPGREGASVELDKFLRADLPIGEAVSSEQCKTQTRKNNQWALIQYTIEHDDGRLEKCLYICQFLYFVRARFRGNVLPEGATPAGKPQRVPAVLKLGVARVYRCEEVHGPGVRPADSGIGRLHEFVRVNGIDTLQENCAMEGLYVLDLRTIDSQVVPTRPRDNIRYFTVANKLSGRTAGVKR